ncbi:MAG TPA: cupredoxin domain-containing protein, partial [Dehalococcoidia bacterium]|nr:cupredoxin domain-containing protein [Dehalococcoidia bacterium]
RLRRFRPSRSVDEILHPPLTARVGEYAYLAGIALLAVAIGAAALTFSGGMWGDEMSSPAHAESSQTADHAPPAGVAVHDTAPVQRVTVQLDEFGFAPASVVVKANQPVEVTMRNLGQVEHDWVPQGLGQPVHTHAGPGESASVRFTPTDTGTFKVVCTEPGHESAGMVGELIVE